MSYLEDLAKAILEGRVSLSPHLTGSVYTPELMTYRIVVDPDPEQEAIESIKAGKVV